MAKMRLPIRFAFLLCVLFNCAACSLFSVDKSVHYEDPEGYFSETLVSAIKPNITSSDWLLATFGSPLHSMPLAEDVKVYTWRISKQTRTKRSLLLLFRYRKLEEEIHYLHAVTQHDVVLKTWQDPHQQVDTMGALRLAVPLDKPPSLPPNNSKVQVVDLPVLSAPATSTTAPE